MLLENEQFLSELSKMFQKSRSSGSVSITMKRWDGHTKPKSSDPNKKPDAHLTAHHSSEYKCLFRAKLGTKKIATVVNAKEVNKFQLAYANVIKLNVDNLKKRDRKSDKDKKQALARSTKSDH